MSRIWFSGIIGLFLPLCVAVSIASLMTESGENLYWHPSLYLGFDWALVELLRHSSPGIRNALTWALISTVTYPALLSIVSIRFLTHGWSLLKRVTLLAPLAFSLWWVTRNPSSGLNPPYDRVQLLWAGACAGCWVIAGLSCFVRSEGNRARTLS